MSGGKYHITSADAPPPDDSGAGFSANLEVEVPLDTTRPLDDGFEALFQLGPDKTTSGITIVFGADKLASIEAQNANHNAYRHMRNARYWAIAALVGVSVDVAFSLVDLIRHL